MTAVTYNEFIALKPCHATPLRFRGGGDEIDHTAARAYIRSIGLDPSDAVEPVTIAAMDAVPLADRVWFLSRLLEARDPRGARQLACDIVEQLLGTIPDVDHDSRVLNAVTTARRAVTNDAPQDELRAAWDRGLDAMMAARWEKDGDVPGRLRDVASAAAMSSAPLFSDVLWQIMAAASRGSTELDTAYRNYIAQLVEALGV